MSTKTKQDVKLEYMKENGIDDPSLIDVHREVPRAEGGRYIEGNMQVMEPIDHMKLHGNFRERSEPLQKLKTLVDGRNQLMKTKVSISNRLKAWERGVDHPDEVIFEFLTEHLEAIKARLNARTREVNRLIASFDTPVVQSALNVRGVGAITVAYMVVYVDIAQAPRCSSLWKYTGLDKPSHERYTKGKSSGGNKTLRCALWNMAGSQIRQAGVYRELYYKEKAKKEVSEKMTTTTLAGGRQVRKKWKDVSDGHRDDHAKRMIMKNFLADWWKVHRVTEGLETPDPFPKKIGLRWVEPDERGWEF